MAKVVMFPTKKRLPKGIEERMNEVAKEYIELLYAALMIMGVDDPAQPEYEEVTELITEAFANGLCNAIDELNES